MIRRPPRSTQSRSSAASDVYKRQQELLAQAEADFKSHAASRTAVYLQIGQGAPVLRNYGNTIPHKDGTERDVWVRDGDVWKCSVCPSSKGGTFDPANARFITKIQHNTYQPVSYTHLRAHETVLDLVCRLLLEKKTKKSNYIHYQY
eukprot:TRINITY_DN19355_c0_g1_i1.p1 TRINITY_DN19355_c0_g1~~TRINITY_DN19355_c0_g1_i1.p1  ORF type:complete len:147 (-),score=56.88 TRINITY_DN19355_c0_g1_i1:13-453(-)